MHPENNTENNVPATDPAQGAGEPPVATRRSLDDPNATFEDLPFKPQLTEKQAKRANQTFKGMVLSIGFTVAIVVPLLLLNPSPKEESFKSAVELQQIAEQAEQIADFDVFAPKPEGNQYANFARWQSNAAQGVPYWEFGLVEDDKEFVWVRQSGDANPTWVALITEAAAPTETRTIGGSQWEVRVKDRTTYLISERADSTVILSSDTSAELLARVAEQVEAELD